MKKTILRTTVSLLFILGVSLIVSAQVGPPLGGTGPAGCFPPPCIPIDGGLSILIAAAVGIGGKKAYDFAKEN